MCTSEEIRVIQAAVDGTIIVKKGDEGRPLKPELLIAESQVIRVGTCLGDETQSQLPVKYFFGNPLVDGIASLP